MLSGRRPGASSEQQMIIWSTVVFKVLQVVVSRRLQEHKRAYAGWRNDRKQADHRMWHLSAGVHRERGDCGVPARTGDQKLPQDFIIVHTNASCDLFKGLDPLHQVF